MVTQLAREGLDVGDERDVAASLQAARRDLHAERSAADHNDRRTRRDALFERDRVLDRAQGELRGKAVVPRLTCSLRGGEALRPGTGGDDKAVIRQFAAPVEPDDPGLDVQA